MIIPQNNFRDEELFETKNVFEKKGIEVKVAAPKKEKGIGKLGGEIMPDLSFNQIKINDYQAIIFIGGPGTADYFRDDFVLDLAKGAYEAKKIVAAICIAPTILANAGLLKGKRVTAFPSEEEDILNKGAIYTGNVVEASGNIITGRGPEAATEFAQKIIQKLK